MGDDLRVGNSMHLSIQNVISSLYPPAHWGRLFKEPHRRRWSLSQSLSTGASSTIPEVFRHRAVLLHHVRSLYPDYISDPVRRPDRWSNWTPG